MVAVLTLVTGIAYPLAMTGFVETLFPVQANGSLITNNDKLVGSKFIGQNFSSNAYFHSRPSAAGSDGYDASASSGSNLGPTNQKLQEDVSNRLAKIREENKLPSGKPIPGDLVLTSASGLDPHITPEAAYIQLERVANARGVNMSEVKSLIDKHRENRQLGFLGEPRVNVLELNLALDTVK